MPNSFSKDEMLGFLKHLEAEGVCYAVLRNALNFGGERNDIDVLVDESSMPKLQDVVSEFAFRIGVRWYRRKSSNYYILYSLEEEGVVYVRFDFVSGLSSRGFRYMEADTIFRRRVLNREGIYVLSLEDEFFHVLVHSIFGPEYNLKKYQDYLESKLMEVNLPEVAGMLSQVFSKRMAGWLINSLRNENVLDIYRRKASLWRVFIIEKNYTAAYFFKMLSRAFGAFFRRIKPSGLFVVLTGPDGVGKSTAAKYATELFEAVHVPVSHMHLGFRPNILPTKKAILKFGKSVEKSAGKSTTPGLLRFFYHTLDFMLGYLMRVRPLLCRGRVIIAERYYYNYLVDPRIKRELGYPDWLCSFLFLFIRKPDMFILLTNKPEVIHERRTEHDIAEIMRQLIEYRNYGVRIREFFEVKTDKSQAFVALEVFECIDEIFRRRC